MEMSNPQNDDNNRINKAARDVLRLSRNTLIVNLRFLDVAISRLEPVPIDNLTLATDGSHFGYGPKFLLKRFKEAPEQTARDYLHVVLHCVFSHMFVSTLIDKEWIFPIIWLCSSKKLLIKRPRCNPLPEKLRKRQSTKRE